MKILVFDIENACSYTNSAICSIGAVESDGNFLGAVEHDILINPKCKIKMKYVDLKVTDTQLKKAPVFRELYPAIRDMLSSADYVAGHAVSNDFNMLNAACRKNGLAPIDCRSIICTQKLYSAFVGNKRSFALNLAAEQAGIDLHHHDSKDDARAAFYLLKYICESEKLSFSKMLEFYGVTPGTCISGKFVNMSCKKLDRIRAVAADCKYLGEYAANCYQDPLSIDNKTIYFKKRIMFDTPFMDDKSMFLIVERLISLGAVYTNSHEEADIFISACSDTSKERRVHRYMRLAGKNIIIMQRDELIDDLY